MYKGMLHEDYLIESQKRFSEREAKRKAKTIVTATGYTTPDVIRANEIAKTPEGSYALEVLFQGFKEIF